MKKKSNFKNLFKQKNQKNNSLQKKKKWNRQPFPVDLTKTDTVKEVNKALSSTYIYLGKGSCSTIKVGRTTQSQKEILENIETVILHLKKILPQKGSTVSFYNFCFK